MTEKELKQYGALKREIEQDTRTVRALEHAAEPGAQRYTYLPHAPGITDRVGEYAAEIADLQTVIGERCHTCMQERVRLERYISAVDDSLIRQILHLRYVRGLPWRDVAAQLGSVNSPETLRQMAHRYVHRGQ